MTMFQFGSMTRSALGLDDFARTMTFRTSMKDKREKP